MNNSLYNRLCQFMLTLFALFYGIGAHADGSRNLYPSGATGARAFLASTGRSVHTNATAANSYAFPTLGTHYAYVALGETIYVGSSAQNTGSGRIRLIAPDGQEYNTAASTTGRIVNRTQELAGPNRAGVEDGYVPFSREVSTAAQVGVWRVEFIPPVGENTDGVSSPGTVAADDDWTQPSGNNLIAAWDVSVSATGNGNLIEGRVYANVLNLALDINSFAEAASFNGTTYALTKDGYVYRVRGNGLQGMYYTFFVNNKGFYAPNLSGDSWTGLQWRNASPTDLPSYKSFDYSNYGDLIETGPWLQDPRDQDSPTGITHKMFYTIPANYAGWNHLPASADVLINKTTGAENAVETWLRPQQQVIPEILGFRVAGVEGENEQASNKGAYIYFDANLAGTVRIRIEPDPTDPNAIAFTPRELIAVAEAGTGNPNNVVYWDGEDGDGNLLPAGILPTRVSLRLQGAEVHFPYLDMEINPNGLIIERLNPANFSDVMSDIVYWDDSKITLVGGTTAGTRPSPTVVPITGSGNNSSVNAPGNGHRWGLHGVGYGDGSGQASRSGRNNSNHGFGNERGIDTYTFILGDETTRTGSIRSLQVDLQVLNLNITQDFTGTEVRPGDTFNYQTSITNTGPSHALAEYDGNGLILTTGSYFQFYLPNGVVPTDLGDITVAVGADSPAGAREVPEFTRTHEFDTEVGMWKVRMMVDLPVDGVLDITIPVEATSAITPGADLVAWSTVLRAHDVNEYDATNLSSTSGGDPIPPTNPFFECQGTNPSPTNPVIFNPNAYTAGDLIPCNNLMANTVLRALLDPDLEFVKTYALTTDLNDNDVIEEGDILTYTFTVKNTGNVTLTDIALTESGFSGSGTHPIPVFVSSTQSSPAGTLLPGEEATYTGTYTVTAADLIAGQISNQATVNADDPNGDPVGPVDSGNDPGNPGKPGEPGDPTVVDLIREASLSIVKTDNSTTYTPGDVVEYTITVTNNGPADAIGVIVGDVFPTGTEGEWTAVLNGGATGTITSGGTVTAINETVNIPNGSSIEYTVILSVPSDYTGNLINTAEITLPTGTIDPDPDDNTSTDENTPVLIADLDVLKTGPATYTPGETVTYEVIVTNNGPSNVVAATVQDILPAGTTGSWTAAYDTGISGGAYTGTPISGHIMETVDIPNGAQIIYTVVVNVPSGHTGAVANTATVAVPSGTIDPTPGNNTSTSTNNPNPVYDLSITKDNGQTTYSPGTTVTYTVTVSNGGPSDLVGARVIDNLPVGTTGSWSAVMNGNATGAISGTGNINQVVNIAAGASIVYTVNVVVPSDFMGNLVNTATLQPTGDPSADDIDDTDTDTPAPVADLSIVKTDGSATYSPGTTVRYTVTVRNNGPADVTGATVSDIFPGGLTGEWTVALNGGATGAANGNGTNINQTVNIPNGGSIIYTVDIDVPSSFTGDLVNTATVAVPSGTTDPNPDNDTSTDTNTPAPRANLSVVKNNGQMSYSPGTTVTYTVTVSNNGPADASNAVVTDNLPAGTTGSWTAVLSTGATGNTAGTGHINETVSIPNGGSINYTVSVDVPSNFTGDLVNTARVAPPTGTTDPDPSDNNETDTDTPAPVADLRVVKTGPATYTPGQSVTYTVTVINDGPANVVGATVTDNAPANTTISSWSASFMGGASGATVSGSGNISQSVDIPNGGSIIYTVTLNVPSSYSGSLVNTARVDLPTIPGSPTDPNTGNNEDSSPVATATPVSDLSIVKTDNSATYTPGGQVVYTITVTNDGPSDVIGATVTDIFPTSGGSIPVNTTGQWTVVNNGGATGGAPSIAPTNLINQVVNIPNGGSIVYTVTLSVPSNYTGNLSNTASVTLPTTPGSPTDPDPSNNSSTDTNTPALVADLSVVKAGPAGDYVPGSPVVYTVTVTNNGPSNVTNATVSDILPAGTTGSWTAVMNANPSVPGSSPTGNTTGTGHINELVNIPNGANIVYTVTVNVPSGYTGELVNSASVTPPSGVVDPTPANNTSSVSIDPDPTVNLTVTKSDGSTTYSPGTTVTYTVTVSNSGPSDLIGATITDNLPTGTTGTWTAIMNGGATGGTSGTGDISQVVNIPNGSSIVYTVHVDVPSNYVGSNIAPDVSDLVNTVTVTVPAGITNIGSTTATDRNERSPLSDLSIVKTDNSATYIPGGEVVYTITVTNNGPANIIDAVVTDNVPAGIPSANFAWRVVSETSGSSAPVASGTGSLNQAVTILNGGVIVYEVRVGVPSGYTNSDATRTLVNTASVAAPTGTTDPNPDNDTSTDTNTPAPVADLSVTKDGPATYSPGTTVTYTVTVTNDGPSDVTGAVVTDNLPAGTTGTWEVTSSTNASATVGSTGTGHINETVNILNGGSIVYAVMVNIPSGFTGDLVNTARATVPSGTTDDDPSNNSSTVTSTSTPQTDLSIEKVNSTGTFTPGETVVYTITVENAGPADVVGATVTDALPAGITAATWTANFIGGASGAGSGGIANGNIIDDVLVNIPNGGSIVYTVRAEVPSDFVGASLINTATVALPVPFPPLDPRNPTDPNLANNTDSDNSSRNAVADLSIVKTDNSATYTPGTNVVYAITVSNDGPSNVIGAEVTDNFPTGLEGTWTVVSQASASGATPSAGPLATMNQLVDIQSGGSIVYQVTVAVPSDFTGDLTNTATVTVPTGTTDPDPSNNTSTDTNTPALVADLSVVKTGPAGDYVPGSPVVYTVTVTNNGPSNVTNATVSDILPAGTTGGWTAVMNANPSVPGSSPTGNTVGTGHINELVNIPNGANIVYTVTVNVPSGYTGELVNSASVTPPSGVVDPTPANNTSSVNIDPDPTVNLTVTKSDGSTTYSPGTTVTYTVTVSNSGPSDLIGATITDNLPTGTTGTWTAVMTGGATGGTFGTGDINQSVNIPSGSSIVYTVHVDVPSNYTGSNVLPGNTSDLVNTVTVTVPAGITNNGGNTATDRNERSPLADLSIVKTDNSATYIPGMPVVYTITVRNNGPADVLGATVTDALPTGTTGSWTAAYGTGVTGGNYTGTAITGDINETALDIPNGGTIVYTITVNVPSSFTGDLVNTATAGVPTGVTDPNPDNDTSTDTNTPAPVADLQVIKTGPATYSPGTTVTYTVTVTNDGPSDVTGAVVTDNLPAGTTGMWEVTASTSASATVGATGTGHINETVNIANGGSIVYTVTVNIPSSFTGNLVNTARATVPSGTTDDVSSNNSSTVTSTSTPQTDLSIEKVNSTGTFTPGETVIYTITVRNTGPADVVGATITDALPTGITQANWTANFVGAASGAASGSAVNGNIIDEVSVNIPNGGSIVYTVTVHVPSSFTGDGINNELVNTATVSHPADADGITGNNTSTDNSTLASVADLSIVKTDNSATYTPGEQVVYTITVRNNGPSDVVGARVVDNLPITGTWTVAQVNASGATDNGGSASNAIDQLVNIQSGGSIVYTVAIDVPSGFTGDLINTATVTAPAGTNDPDNTNNSSTDINTPALVADLAVTKTVSNAAAQIGDVVTFTVTATNNGTSDATDVIVTDLLPSGYTLQLATPSVGTYDAVTGVWEVGTLTASGVGASATLTITALVRSTGDYRNVAVISSPAHDPNPDNNRVVRGVSVITAFDDHLGTFNGATGGTSVGNVLTNDLLNGASATLGTGPGQVTLTSTLAPPANPADPQYPYLDITTGRVIIPAGTPAGTYTVPYQICEFGAVPDNCDNAEATVVVTAAPIQALDNTFGPVRGDTGDPNVGNVLNNDSFNGSTLTTTDITNGVITLTVTTPATPIGGGPVPAIDESTGQVSVPTGTPDGTYTITYQICEVLNPTNCSTAEVRVTVGSSNIDAIDDNYLSTPINGANGITLPSVLSNDILNGAQLDGTTPEGNPALVTLTPGASPLPGQITMDNNGVITVAAGTPAGTYSYPYRICEVLNPNNCDDAIAVFRVSAPAIIANIDDNYLSINGRNGGIAGDATGNVSVVSNDRLNGNLLNPLRIVTDTNPAGDITLTPGTPPHPGISMDATGFITVAAGTPAGTYTYPYTICEVLNPTNCSSSVAIINVTAAAIVATDDFTPPAQVNGYTGGNTANVLDNDLLNGVLLNSNVPTNPGYRGLVTLTPGTAPTPVSGSITMNPDGTISVAPGTTAGTYTYPYTICEVLNPTNCAEATATVEVLAPAIDAVDDTFGPVNGATGSNNVGNALTNDLLNNAQATIGNVSIANLNNDTFTPSGGVPATPLPTTRPVLDVNTGIVSVPAGTPAGTYTIDYRITDRLNPGRTDDATITVTVTAAPIIARPDQYGPITTAAGHPNLGNILVNDELNGQQATAGVGGNVTLNVNVAGMTFQDLDGNPSVTVPVATTLKPAISTEGVVSVPSGTPAGTYTIPYTICEVLNPTNCSSTTVTVVVSRTPILAVNDRYGPVVGLGGNANLGNALDNDLFNNLGGRQAYLDGDIRFGTVTPATPITGAVNNNVPVLNTTPGANGGIVSVPPMTPAGIYTITYTIEEVDDPTNTSTATITIEVTAAVIDPDDDFFGNIDGITGNTTATGIGNVLTNDKLNFLQVVPADVNVTVLQGATSVPGAVNALVPVLTTTGANKGTITVPAGTPAGEYAIRYQICEVLNPTNCDWATAYINVVAPIIDAINDTYTHDNSVTGNTNIGNVLDNDRFNSNVAGSATIANVEIEVLQVALPLQGAPNNNVPYLTASTGVVTVPANTPAGQYQIHYRICDRINPSRCDDAFVTVNVWRPGVNAVDDDFGPVIGMVGDPNLGNILTNDSYNGGAAISDGPNANVNISVLWPARPNYNAVNNLVPLVNTTTGVVSVPQYTPAGTYQIQYRITDRLNPSNFDDAVVTVRVTAAAIVANNDFVPEARINGYVGGTTVSVLDNDLLNGDPLSPARIGTNPGDITLTPDMDGPYPGKLTFNTDGTITVAPQTEAGTYRWWYTICEVLNPGNCARAVATVIVEAAPIQAVDDDFRLTIERFGSTTPSVLDNDLLNGVTVIPSEVTLTPGTPSNNNLTMNPDGTINVPQGMKEGTYTYPYTICEVLNPTNCSSAVATITIGAADLFIPNTFTPNGDGKNDTFELIGWEAYDRIELTVFNRWGNEVYRNVDYDNSWTGAGLNEGTYYYMVNLIKGNTTDTRKGWVLIKRN